VLRNTRGINEQTANKRSFGVQRVVPSKYQRCRTGNAECKTFSSVACRNR